MSIGAKMNRPSGKTSNPGHAKASAGGVVKKAGPCFDLFQTAGTGSTTSEATCRTLVPRVSIMNSACLFQKRIERESGEYRGAYPPSFKRSRLPPEAGIVQIEIAPPRAEENAIDWPSDDQSGAKSISSASVTRSALPLRMSSFQTSSFPLRSI